MRRLPVLQSGDEVVERPASQWVAIAAALCLAFWVPLVVVALGAGRALATKIAGVSDVSELARSAATASVGQRIGIAAVLIVPALGSLALAAAASGAVVGRFGGRAGGREAVLGSGIAAAVSWGLAWSGGGLRPWTLAVTTGLLVTGVSAAFAGLGARLGRRRRPQP
ncbi:MAG: hypothetical protein U0263_04735 [Polyangiaceae bacterium]